MDKNIFLIGMPSSGKSTLGKNLAKLLNYEFVDMDSRIIATEGLTVNEIFTLKGEEYFRQIESQHLRKIATEQKIIVATGGGTPCHHNGMEFIKQNGISIFLNVSPEILAERVKHSRSKDRPMFKSDSETLYQDLKKRYELRLPFYTQADLSIEGDTDAESILWLLEYNLKK
jgi:shikimate kinase